MKSVPANWLDWWHKETIISHGIWQNNMQVFISATMPVMNYGAQDVILDIGSGPGYLASFLKDRVKEIHCLDISEHYIDLLRNSLGQYPHIFSYKLSKDKYTELSFLKPRKFSIIICQSVVQYYESIDEVEALIRQVRDLALPGARFLISDIPTSPKTATSASGFLKTARENPGLLVEKVKVLIKLSVSKNGNPYGSLRLLCLSDDRLKEMIETLDLNAEILSARLTTNENRKHLLIRF